MTILAGAPYEGVPKDGPSAEARFSMPSVTVQYDPVGTPYLTTYTGPGNIVSDMNGNIYVRDLGIRKISPLNVVSTIVAPYSPFPIGHLAIDSGGTLYFTVANAIHKVDADGADSILFTGTRSYQSGPGSVPINSAETTPFYNPGPIAFDAAGNLYVSDTPYIRRISKDGSSTVFATLPREFGATTSMTIDANNNVFLTQAEVSTLLVHSFTGTNRSLIVRITPAGMVDIISGSSEPSSNGYADGPGATAKFTNPSGIAADNDGNLYVADMFNHVIRKIDANGAVSTVAGTPNVDLLSMGTPPAIPPTLSKPSGLTFIGPKTLAVTSNSAVVKVALP